MAYAHPAHHDLLSAYIARMLGELLEDTDPCEAVEYVLPLLTGLALDEGKQFCYSALEKKCAEPSCPFRRIGQRSFCITVTQDSVVFFHC
jgi:hypothetical protein